MKYFHDKYFLIHAYENKNKISLCCKSKNGAKGASKGFGI
jgi:hypothetical protein